MSLVKHGRGVLLANQEDDPFAGGVDNAIILYRAIEKDRMSVGGGIVERGEKSGSRQAEKDILWSPNDPGTMTFLRTGDINRLALARVG